ncbi:C4-dicarboxylate ABC transporter [Helicobacter sp. MIT 11-5569]|uniref:SLAC1 anion channel family protein n=1 Tax=Helicobacter sp. MIT 11-5569 TaxID=1548151 RepID=UPI0010FD9410|nr:SLAC1 anion channel family protein [Helicobacter sp. MIT 11-5569]TLD84453.1 C4-dicarboxylate ABC transporter [Helicobacter sp. MIT 11-5569]
MESQNTQCQVDSTQNWLLHFPIMFFASIMGIGGLSLVVSKSMKVFDLSAQLHWLFISLVIFSTFLLCVITLLYGLKIIKYFNAFKKELKHPIRINFFAATSVSILIVLMLLLPFIPQSLALSLFYIGAGLQLIFSLYVVRFWFVNEMQQKMANPAWFIPIVGNLIVPLAGMQFNTQNYIIPFEILIFYFGMGSFFWILLNAALLIRLVFGENLPQKFLPTLFIFIAPPSVFALDILVLFKDLSHISSLFGIASASFSIALFFMLLMISMFGVFRKVKFALSWWAFTFPTAAFTLCALELYTISHSSFYVFLGIFGIVLTVIIVCVVSYYTLIAIKNREICVLEE